MQTCGHDSRQAGHEQTKRVKDEVHLRLGRRGDDGGSSGGDSRARQNQRIGTTPDDGVGMTVEMRSRMLTSRDRWAGHTTNHAYAHSQLLTAATRMTATWALRLYLSRTLTMLS